MTAPTQLPLPFRTAPTQLPLPFRTAIAPRAPAPNTIPVMGPMLSPPWSKLVPLRTAAGLAGNVPGVAPSRTPGVYLIFQKVLGRPTFISRGHAGDGRWTGLRERLQDHANCARRICGNLPDYSAQWMATRNKEQAAAWELAIIRAVPERDLRELEMVQETAEFLYELASELASTGGADPFSRSALR